jgi:hypothetical protein
MKNAFNEINSSAELNRLNCLGCKSLKSPETGREYWCTIGTLNEKLDINPNGTPMRTAFCRLNHLKNPSIVKKGLKRFKRSPKTKILQNEKELTLIPYKKEVVKHLCKTPGCSNKPSFAYNDLCEECNEKRNVIVECFNPELGVFDKRAMRARANERMNLNDIGIATLNGFTQVVKVIRYGGRGEDRIEILSVLGNLVEKE